jgi:hypothetical protein
MMQRSLILTLALATLSSGAQAQSADAAGQAPSPDTQSQPAPIVRSYGGQSAGSPYPNQQANGQNQPSRRIDSTQPIPGVWLRTTPESSVQTVSADAKGTELRVSHGVANVSVHHPGQNARILVDLPGGQIALLKDGMYTFNAESNTVRVLKGEADAYPGNAAKGTKVKEDQQFVLTASGMGSRSTDVSRGQLMSDYLPGGNGDGDSTAREGRPGAPYGDGFYGYPGYGYGYPYPYAYGLYPYGYPYVYGVGLGFGYYGGFRGGFRGRLR